MSAIVSTLAARAGIEDGYRDFFGHWHDTTLETKQALLAAMRLPAGTDAEAQHSLDNLDRDAWERVLPTVSVVEDRQGPAFVATCLPAAWDGSVLALSVIAEDGRRRRGEIRVGDLAPQAEHRRAGQLIRRRLLPLPDMPVGEYRLVLDLPDGSSTEQALIVAPGRAYSPQALDAGAGLWGIATQIYALRRKDDWGIGDFTSLAEMGLVGAELGASAIGINPLHALFGARPDRFGPYAPSSRCFLNTAYIDVTVMPEFAACEEARIWAAAPSFQHALKEARDGRIIDYEAVGRLKREILERLYLCFRTADGRGKRAEAFRAFQVAGGGAARDFAIFEALQEHMLRSGADRGYWRAWPEGLRRPDSAEVRRFAEAHADRVEFFWWLQFIADEQSDSVQRICRDAGMPIGLYRDLGVGIAEDGAEAWAHQDCAALSVSIGAPPDPLAPKGQDWGLVPFDPLALRAQAYAPFRQVMAANMRHAGAMRLDHAMSLQRLYWVPRGMGADQGAYVRYPVDDLFALVALESQRQRCMVIGEDLGTVPEGFRDRMADHNIFAYRVLYFEKDQDGAFRPPEGFARQALTTVGTHDLPSLRGWWRGYDLELRAVLNLFPEPGHFERAKAERAADRSALVAALHGKGLLDADFPTGPLLDDAMFETLMRATHAFVGGAASRLVMTQIEDVLGVELQMNLPGTIDEHPNWRQRYAVDIDALAEDPRLRQVALGLLADRDFRASDARTAR